MTEHKSEDYGYILRRRRRYFGGLMLLGLLGVIVSIGLLPQQVPFPARTFYQGGSWGIFFSGLFQLVRIGQLLKHPERWKERRVQETDERQRHIDREAAQFAGAAVVLLQLAAALVLVVVDWRLGVLLDGLILAYVVFWLTARWWLSKQL